MCLETITETGLNKSGYGWKVFMIRNGKLYSDNFFTENPKRLNRWLKAKRVEIKVSGNKYSSGFHIFTKREDALLWQRGIHDDEGDSVIKQVEYRKAHTTGTQDGCFLLDGDTIVADEMLILPKKISFVNIDIN